ncbi:MAG: DUF885 domain-containing protein [Gammaproteobacteria bacterium]|nr:DUF885 domain-containing protein [Gammaproteobacteria bacterium]
MDKLFLILAMLLIVDAHADPGWIEQSNLYARQVMDMHGRYNPERISAQGLEEYDANIMDLKQGVFERRQAETRRMIEHLQQELDKTTDPRVTQDLYILIKRLQDNLQARALHHELMLPYYNLSEWLYSGFQSLLDSRVESRRYSAAMSRLKKYTGRQHGYRPIVELAKARTQEAFNNTRLIGPYIQELTQDRENLARYVQGISELFKSTELQGWQEDFHLLQKQLMEYDAWLEKNVIPRARATHLLPPEIYAQNLKDFGVEMDPADLIRIAQFSFADIREEMQGLAKSLAQIHDLPSDDYRQVIAAFKKDQLDSERIVAFYQQRMNDIDRIIKNNRLISLPQRKTVIRLATQAESARIPAPYLDTPQLLGNTGQTPEFVLPLNNPNAAGKGALDDFTFAAVAWTMAAHEVRPGHELQMSSLIEKGISLARALYAYNSANVEGWALYAEAIMQSHFPPEGQFFSLQLRLLRAARAFLDPMLNLGQIKPAEAKQFLMTQVGLSEAMATQEVDRYSFKMPGQATSYFYGYSRLMALRTETELKLKQGFDQLAYHDFLIAQGLLPLDLLRRAVLEEFVPAT